MPPTSDSAGSSLPSPEDLKQYESASPGLGTEIVRMVQDEQRHLHAVDLAEISLRRRGQLFGFIIAIAFLAVAGFLISGNHDIAGTVIGSVDLVALTTVFVVGQRTQRSEIEPTRSEDTDRLIRELRKNSRKTSRERRQIEASRPAHDLAVASSGKESSEGAEDAGPKGDSNDDANTQSLPNDDPAPDNGRATADDPRSLSQAQKPPLSDEDRVLYRRFLPRSDDKDDQQRST